MVMVLILFAFSPSLPLSLSLNTVIGAVALTMQPLWPDSTRAGMWYLSMGVFVLMGAMVSLIVGKFISYPTSNDSSLKINQTSPFVLQELELSKDLLKKDKYYYQVINSNSTTNCKIAFLACHVPCAFTLLGNRVCVSMVDKTRQCSARLKNYLCLCMTHIYVCII